MTSTQLPEITPEERTQLDELYAAFEAAHMTPLWTQIGGLMPTSPVVTVGDERYEVGTGDPFCVPFWAGLAFDTDSGLDAFRYSDDPVLEALGLARTESTTRTAREDRS